MKKIVCLFVLLALTCGVHADDKKKKSAPSKKAPAGGGGGMHMPSASHGNPAHGLGQTGRTSSGSHAGTSTTNHLKTHSSTSGPASGRTGQAGAASHSSNPLLRKSGQAGSTAHSSNPLTPNNNHQAGAKSTNPLAKKGASQAAMNGHNPNMNGKRAFAAQNAHGFNNRAGNWQHGAHANYHVRPYGEVFHNYHAVRHDRGWYSSHYDRVVVVGGGYYYWDAGYWYPAWGYDPAFSFYVYDGPIYSYANLPPDQVTMNVQTELQDEGYYTGEVDGQVGPKTRDALGVYQADHNLEVTSAIDEPTVEALGLTGTS
ncbi:MAG TPA: peptidoglycan-binding domain-containing protein [Chthoniobacterales bacterium]|nr:peptidoglycan-binding domain-containing protein [Chthoniobacterales bacterium]